MIAPVQQPPSSTGAMNVIAALLEQRTGQQIAANRAWRIETALKPVLRDRGLETLDQLVGEIVANREPALADKVVEALLNQETSFFRDAAVLDQIVEAIGAMQRERPDQRLRIWCAGCSTGQEPLSLAMLLTERPAGTAHPMPEILATDISARAIARARAARYTQFEIQRGLPVRRMISWFDGGDTEWVAKPELVGKVQYRRHNLAAEPPPPVRFDIVLCRNVLLYFSLPLRRRVYDQIVRVLRPGGLLVLGAGETVIGQTDALVPSSEWRGFYTPRADAAPPLAASAG